MKDETRQALERAHQERGEVLSRIQGHAEALARADKAAGQPGATDFPSIAPMTPADVGEFDERTTPVVTISLAGLRAIEAMYVRLREKEGVA